MEGFPQVWPSKMEGFWPPAQGGTPQILHTKDPLPDLKQIPFSPSEEGKGAGGNLEQGFNGEGETRRSFEIRIKFFNTKCFFLMIYLYFFVAV